MPNRKFSEENDASELPHISPSYDIAHCSQRSLFGYHHIFLSNLNKLSFNV